MVINRFNTLENPAKCGIFCFKAVLIFYFVLTKTVLFSQPKLEIKDSKKNFGFVKKGEQVKLVFQICNKGNAPLIINDVEVSCTCTSVDFPKQPILAGQQATITLTFETQNVYYRQDRVAFINSNDPHSDDNKTRIHAFKNMITFLFPAFLIV
jgi:hypothetical protein